MLRAFEKLVDPYPETAPATPPGRLLPFVWHCTRGMRPFIAAMTLATAVIGVFEAVLFAMLGRVVDWLAEVPAARLWVNPDCGLKTRGTAEVEEALRNMVEAAGKVRATL